MKRDEATYGRIRRKYEEWVEIQANRPPTPRVVPPHRPYTPEPVTHGDMGKTLSSAIGIGIGAVLLLLSIPAFANAVKWADYGRDGAFVGYLVVGFFLVVAGAGGIIATWNHNFRVLARADRRQAH